MPDQDPAQSASGFFFTQFKTFVAGIELLYKLGRRLPEATANQHCEYLIQEASMAFVKMLMSLLGFLRFIPSSQYHAKAIEVVIDLSSASVMARQIMEDAISFFYLSEPGLTQKQKKFREMVWRFQGGAEGIESARFANISHHDLPNPDRYLDPYRKYFAEPEALEMLNGIEGGRRGRIRIGQENHVLHDREILERRGIQIEVYDLGHKVLSNFAHFSTFSHQMMMGTNANWEKSWEHFLLPTQYVANFAAETIEAFLETFPQTRQLLSKQEQAMIADFRSWRREKFEPRVVPRARDS
jgi:hypothetical protein